MITVIAPHARPEFSANLLANFRRQLGLEARLLVVENGAAEGSFPREADVHVITSSAHQADAMNEGLRWLRENGDGPWARFDDDDYYGPSYLKDTTSLLESAEADVVGKRWGFVMFNNGLWRFISETAEFTGGTLAARTADVISFPQCADDDLEWCRRMRADGKRLVVGDPYGYCYNRRSRAAPRVILGGSTLMRYAFGAGYYYGSQPFEAVNDRMLCPLRLVPLPAPDEILAALDAMEVE